MPQFDTAANAWVLDRHADVLAALRDPRLEPGEFGGKVDEASHRAMREASHALFSAEKLAAWQTAWRGWAEDCFAQLPPEADLIAGAAAPLSLRIASQVAGVPAADAPRLAVLARDLFAITPVAGHATLELGDYFRVKHGEAASALWVQAFTALAHSLAALLGNAWLALLEHPAEMLSLAAAPERMPDALEELLRFAGPAALQYRRASVDAEYGGARIARGAKVILRLDRANRDPDVFPDPHRLKLDRHPAGHVAFGAGPHACVGAPLIRLAAPPGIAVFAARFAGRDVAFTAEPESGLAMRSLRSLTPMLP